MTWLENHNYPSGLARGTRRTLRHSRKLGGDRKPLAHASGCPESLADATGCDKTLVHPEKIKSTGSDVAGGDARASWASRQCQKRSTVRRPSSWLVLVILLFCSIVGSGCRTLRDRTSSSHLQRARELSLKGTDAIERQRYGDAEMLFAEALKQSEADERAHWGYANALWKRGERSKAIEHMEQALKLSERSAGGNPEYAIRLGEMYLETGDFGRARQIAEGVLATKRNHAAAWALVGDTHKAERRWDISQECYQRALLIQPDFPKVQLSLAEIYRNMGKPQRALAVLDRMNDLRDTANLDPQALLNRGLALADLNRHVEAKEILAKASERLPLEQLDAHLQIAHAQHRLGELVAARMTLGRVRETHASSTEVHRLQSMLDMSFAHLSDPLQFANPLHQNDPLNLTPSLQAYNSGSSTNPTTHSLPHSSPHSLPLPTGYPSSSQDPAEPPPMLAQPMLSTPGFNNQPWITR